MKLSVGYVRSIQRVDKAILALEKEGIFLILGTHPTGKRIEVDQDVTTGLFHWTAYDSDGRKIESFFHHSEQGAKNAARYAAFSSWDYEFLGRDAVNKRWKWTSTSAKVTRR